MKSNNRICPASTTSDPEAAIDDNFQSTCRTRADGGARGRGSTLSWSNINVNIIRQSSNNQGSRQNSSNSTILKNVSGVAQANKVTAILGHSGAGKTTLLAALSGRLSSDKAGGVKMTNGNIKLDSVPIIDRKKQQTKL